MYVCEVCRTEWGLQVVEEESVVFSTIEVRDKHAGPSELGNLDKQANHQLSMREKAGVMKPPMTPNTKPSIYMFLNER